MFELLYSLHWLEMPPKKGNKLNKKTVGKFMKFFIIFLSFMLNINKQYLFKSF